MPVTSRNLTSLPTFRRNAHGQQKAKKYAASKIKYLLPPERNFDLCSLDSLPHLEVSFLAAAAYENTSLITPL